MTVRRQWLLMLFFTAIISIGVNLLVLSSLMNHYFMEYTAESYQKHFTQLVEYSKKALEESSSKSQISIKLEAYIDDPIIRITLYDAGGQLLASAGSQYNPESDTMKDNMMYKMMGMPTEEVDNVEISDDGKILGRLNILRYGSEGNTLVTRTFRAALLANSILSIGIVSVFVMLIGFYVSRKMSKDLTHTALLALNIDLGDKMLLKPSKVREIRIIQQSLDTLKARLRIRQASRKKLLDELVHQTRTPLTILKTHLEGFEDGVISMTPEEIKTCENQIDNITTIIANMSNMLDAEKDTETVKLEEFEFSQLLKQIVNGLKIQFDRRQIELLLVSHQKVMLKTDKYKLSQSIYNLLTNAYKFTESRGRVSIYYEADDRELSISIEDTGLGISIEDQKHLFEAYYRGSNAANISGEGIGLYVVHENLSKIDGSINVTSEIGTGSRFTIKIPKRLDY